MLAVSTAVEGWQGSVEPTAAAVQRVSVPLCCLDSSTVALQEHVLGCFSPAQRLQPATPGLLCDVCGGAVQLAASSAFAGFSPSWPAPILSGKHVLLVELQTARGPHGVSVGGCRSVTEPNVISVQGGSASSVVREPAAVPPAGDAELTQVEGVEEEASWGSLLHNTPDAFNRVFARIYHQSPERARVVSRYMLANMVRFPEASIQQTLPEVHGR
ncbi:unnamed protein product [Effrenium voratum]|uniref:Uncharacterized protein n=1 Tax=Effrenium voratum TaxID=2562239 RepID=A0AA36IN94_9DINO|nr:unnamed protein product [Effrenium voratum]